MFHKLKRRELGQGLVEFAVVFPLFMILIFMMVDGGLVMGRYGEVNHAAKEGARFASTGASPADVKDRVIAQSQISLTAGDVSVEYADGPASNRADSGEVGSVVVIRIEYDYDLITPLPNFGGGDLTWGIKACAVARLERPVDASKYVETSNEC